MRRVGAAVGARVPKTERDARQQRGQRPANQVEVELIPSDTEGAVGRRRRA